MTNTYDDYYNECMTQNATQTATINGEQVELTHEECCQACADWAKMKVEQGNPTPPEA